MTLLHDCLLAFIGLSGGIAVGGGFVAFITVLNLIPRLVQLAKAHQYIIWLEYALILGALVFTWMDFNGWDLSMPTWVTIPIGILMGVFVGMLAAALTEVLNVFPILLKRLRVAHGILYFLMAMALGKMIGSLIQWLFALI